MKPMRLEDILFSQGFGTRRVCAGLVQQGYVSVNGEVEIRRGRQLRAGDVVEFEGIEARVVAED